MRIEALVEPEFSLVLKAPSDFRSSVYLDRCQRDAIAIGELLVLGLPQETYDYLLAQIAHLGHAELVNDDDWASKAWETVENHYRSKSDRIRLEVKVQESEADNGFCSMLRRG